MKSKQIYNLNDIGECVAFMQDCVSAINQIPNYEAKAYWNKDIELDIIKGTISAIEVFDKYNKSNCPLNSGGYYSCLSERAKNTFDYVYEYGRYGLKRLCEDGKVFTKFGFRL
jgi:hypothetical protein